MDSALTPQASQAKLTARPLAIANWLLLVAGLVFLMVVVGGITRLTESGLSITEWNPIRGAIPPLTNEQWQHAFDLYKATPEYREINGPAGMDLAQYKFIFFWEWVHRLIGRLIGLAFALPLAWFALKRAIPRATAGDWSRYCCSAAARACSAGTWSCRAWSIGPTSAISAYPRICCWPCSSWPR